MIPDLNSRLFARLHNPSLGLGLRLGLSGGGRGRYSPPPGLFALPLNLIGVNDFGDVDISPADAITAAKINRSAIYNSGVYYLKPSTGSDSNDGLTPEAPFATVAKAMRTATGAASTVLCLEDCTLPSFDVRNTDASQTSGNGFPNGQLKILDANGYAVTIRDVVTELSATTWTQDGTYSNWWKTGAIATGSQALQRVVRSDVLDDEGFSKGLLRTTSAPSSNGTTPAYYWDSTGKVAWVNLGGSDVEANKANLKGLWLNSAGTSRILSIGSAIGFKDIRFEGVGFVSLDGGSRRPDFWLHNCVQLWAPDKGWDGTNAGWYVATDTHVHAALADAANAFAAGAVGKGFIQTANCRFTRAGDLNVIALNGSLQGTSAHGGSDHVGFGNVYKYNNGQCVADTTASGYNDVSWFVGCDFIGGVAASTPNLNFGGSGASRTRKAYLDTCQSSGALNGVDIQIDTNGYVFTRNTTIGFASGTLTPY